MIERTVRQVESVEEVWETTGHGMVFVTVTGVDGKERSISAGGRPGQKLRISEYDRTRCQERVLDDRADVFTNGMLIRVDAPNDGPNVLTAEDIVELFTLRGEAFQERVNELNEYNTRRLLEASEDLDASNSQIVFLKQTIAQKWPIGGDTPMYRELQGLGQVASPTQ